MAEALNIREELETSMTEGDLPSQGGTYVPTVMPGMHTLQLPGNIDQLWATFDVEKKDANGNAILGPDQKPLVEQHLMLKFDKENPLIVVGANDPFNGLPVSATISTLARRRGKKTDPNAPMVSDMTYFLRDSLKDNTQIKFRKDYIPAINAHAGHQIRIESGLQAQCDPERIRYVDDGAGSVIEDPEGTKGCGIAGGVKNGKNLERLYTNDFKVHQFQLQSTGEVYNTREEALEAAQAMGLGAADIKQIEAFVDRIYCKNCGAALRGFFRIERFLQPLASTQNG